MDLLDCEGFRFPSSANLGASEPARLARDTVRHGKGCFYLLNGGKKRKKSEGKKKTHQNWRHAAAAISRHNISSVPRWSVPLSICGEAAACEQDSDVSSGAASLIPINKLTVVNIT